MKTWLKKTTDQSLAPARQWRDRANIFRYGEAATQAYFLKEGSVEILQSNEEGLSLVVKILCAPTFFGAIEMFADEAHYLESVRVLGHAKTHAMSRETFTSLTRSLPELGFECLQDMSVAFCVAARFENAAMAQSESMLANLLLAYADVIGAPSRTSTTLKYKRTQSDFAEAIGAGERTVNRLLKDFRARGLLDKSEARYRLLDIEGLKEIAGSLEGSLVHRLRA